MERKIINPWSWQDAFGYVQANELNGATRSLICSGQTSTSADGQPVHAGDMGAQIQLSLDNVETVLGQAGFSLRDVVRLNIYTTDVDMAERLAKAECKFASTILGVARLAFPEFMVEIEVTAAA